ncbi:MAG: cupin domain-containing protein [Dehalococcoidia bacterium]|nr:MAG: cupin domain-containing protein [Dehalococcoidia bacterium]
MKIVSLEQCPKAKPHMEGAEGIYKQVPISKTDGSPAFSFRVFTIKPGGHTPFHAHPFEHLNYIMEGNGVLVGKDRQHDVKKGDFALVMPGETHQYKNKSTSHPMVMICAVPKEYE